VGSSEMLASRVDLWRLFRYVMQQMGAKNVDDFELQRQPQQPQQIPEMNMNVMPDDQVQREVERGNLIAAA
jgi:hypothetical protein